MANKEISDLALVTTMNSTDLLHVKQGASDVSVQPATLFALHAPVGVPSNPHNMTNVTIGLGNVTNDAQLKIASNLSDLASAATARTNLDVMSTAQVNAAVAAHSTLTTNPHNVTKAQVGLANVQDYTITDDPNENVSNKYASIAAVHNVLQQLLTLGFAAVPVGAIMFWPYNQVTNPIPPRWAPLYGASNGTPIDLRGKFIRCGDNDTVGGIGGADTVTHTHAGQANPTALTVGQLPNFSLSTRCTPNIKFDEYSGGYPALSPGDFAENIQHRTSSIGNGETHSHSVTIDYTTTNNLPSYYTLIPIIYTGVI